MEKIKLNFRNEFSKSEFGSFIEQNQISYYLDGIVFVSTMGVAAIVALNLKGDDDILVRLRVDGEMVKILDYP